MRDESRTVCRYKLFERLDRSVSRHRVTVVSAPAGSGKSLLLRSWIEQRNLSRNVAWVSVERGERDSQRFWVSVVDSFRHAVGDEFVERLIPRPGFGGGAVVERLLSDLVSLEQRTVLVIDDLHELTSAEALADLEVLVTRLPPTLHLILATRHDPQLGLHRLRLAGEMTAVRTGDLRFSVDEARLLLEASGITLGESDLATLHERTEGWAAGLRLAAISLEGHPEPGRFVAEFSGSERMVADYLLAEMLDRQPRDVRDLLLRTSVLDRVSGPLADVMTGGSGSERILQTLAEENAFVVPLDAGRTWFRYHHLFGDLLRLELRRTSPDSVTRLHRTAAEWHAENGLVVTAVRHAQMARDWSRGARLLADHVFTLYLNGEGATLRDLLSGFPAGAADDDAELATVCAADQLTGGSLDGAEAYLDLAEQNAGQVREGRRRLFERSVAVWRLGLARRRCDFAGVRERMATVLSSAGQTPADLEVSKDLQAMALANMGIIELWTGRLDAAEDHLVRGAELARRIGRPYVEMACLAHLAPAAYQESPALVRKRAEAALAIAEANGWETEPVSAIAPVLIGSCDMWAGRFDDADRWLDRAALALRPETEPVTALLLHFARGLVQAGRGHDHVALRELRAADSPQAAFTPPRNLRILLHGYFLQTLARAGQTAAARRMLAQLSERSRRWGEIHVAHASVLLSEGDAAAALQVLAPVIEGATPVTHTASIVEALLHCARAHDLLGDPEAVTADVERALEIAERDRLVLPFVMSGTSDLLERHSRRRTAHAPLLADILDIISGSSPERGEAVPTFEGLSDGELRVLRYLPSNLSAPEIGAELYLSLNTVKTHMRHIYAKLGVHRRGQAVARARELGLVAAEARRR